MPKKSAKNTGFSTKALRKQLDEASKFAEWATAAQAHRSEFQPEVVGAVISGYVEKFDAMLPDLLEVAESARSARQDLVGQAGDMETLAASVEAQIDELKLRHVIGELDAGAFESKQEEARAGLDMDSLESARSSMADIDSQLERLAQVQGSMAEVRGAQGAAPEAAPAPIEPAPAAEVEEVLADVDDDADAASSLVGDSFDFGFTGAPESLPDEDLPAQDAELAPAGDGDEIWDVDLPGASPAAESAEPEVVADEVVADEVVADEVVEAPADEPQDFLATGMVDAHSELDLPAADEDEMEAPPGDGTRLVVTSPGSEAVVYPFNGEVMSLGRGRNNDVQIKNDGKISRYHCRIFRRGDEFVVEDNKSSNGTLVNGKLVTRQRLDGGEQVQVGETRVLFFAT